MGDSPDLIPPRDLQTVHTVHDTLTLISVVGLVGGCLILFISIAANFYKSDFLAAVLANIGTGFITAAIMSLFLERYTKNAIFTVQSDMIRQMNERIESTIEAEIRIGMEHNRLLSSEVLRSI